MKRKKDRVLILSMDRIKNSSEYNMLYYFNHSLISVVIDIYRNLEKRKKIGFKTLLKIIKQSGIKIKTESMRSAYERD